MKSILSATSVFWFWLVTITDWSAGATLGHANMPAMLVTFLGVCLAAMWGVELTRAD